MRYSSPRALALAFVFSLAALRPFASAAQKPAEGPSRQVGPVVKTVDVTVTNLDVVVLDGKGNRVTGLRKEDFEVIEDGFPQTLTNFYAVEGGRLTLIGDEPVPAPPPNAPAAEAEAATPSPKTRIVVFIDNLHISAFNRNRVLRNVEDFVRKSIKGDTEAMIVTWDRSLKIRRKFTSDGRDLADVLRQVEEQSASGSASASERADVIQSIDDAKDCSTAEGKARSYSLSQKNDLEFTIDAMKTTLNQLAGVDGRKILIHVSDGLPQSPGAELWPYITAKFSSSGSSTCQISMMNFEFDKTTGYIGVVQAANAAGVTIYALDAKGLEVDSSVTAESKTTSQRIDTFTERQNLQGMLTLMAEETGGKAVLNSNDMRVALSDIEKDVTSYYSLGYRSIRAGADRPHKVDVKCRRKGVTVRARRSYLEKSPETKVTEAVQSALFFTRSDNPLEVGLEIFQPAPADRQNYLVPIRIRVPYARIALLPEGAKARGRLVFYFLVLDSQGKQSEMARQATGLEVDAAKLDLISKKEYVYDVKLLMIPGGQRLSLAVKDDVTGTTSYLQKSVFVSALPPIETKPTPAVPPAR
jgi:VWFA-related protein